MPDATIRACPGCASRDSCDFAEKNGFRYLRCRPCATLYTSDGREENYVGGYGAEVEPASFLARRLDDIVAGFAPWRRSGRLLDVGFGAGDLLDAARRAGWSVHGVELAQAAVSRARERGIDAFHGTLAEAGYEAESFDVVVGSELVEHVIDVEPVLDEMKRVLRPGGLLWLTTPHGRGLSARLLGAAWSVVNPPEHVQLFSIRGLRELLRRGGFAVANLNAEGVNPHEIVQHLRGRRVRPSQRIGSAYRLNAFLEERPSRRMVKRALNRMLSMSHLGDSLKVWAEKPARHAR